MTVLAKFATCMKDGYTADSDEAQALVKELQNYITENYCTCIAGLGQMCVADERFKNNIDEHAYHSKNCPKKERKAPCHTPEKFGTIEPSCKEMTRQASTAARFEIIRAKNKECVV